MINTEEALSALNYINPSCDRETWIKVGMAAKAAGLKVDNFINWSKDASNFVSEKDCRDRWKSFHDGAITERTLFALAHKNGWKKNSNMPSFSKHNNYQKGKTFKLKEIVVNLYALEIWKRCEPATFSHIYISQKQGNPDGLKVYPENAPNLIINSQNVAGFLVVPCFSGDKIQTLQFIPPNEGIKLNLPRASFNDGFFTVGEVNKKTQLIYICEGIGQAWAINNTTHAVAIVCFGAGRMMQVSKVIRDKYPTAKVIIVSDRGKEEQAKTIAETINGQWFDLPQDKLENYDVNDYMRDHGHEALAHLLANTNLPELRYKLLSIDEVYNSPPMDWIIKGIIPKVGLTALYGASSSGKSFLLLDLALTVVTGEAFWFGRRVNAVPITYVCLEGESGLGKRLKAWFTYTNKALPKSIRFITQPFNLLTEDVNELVKAIVKAGHTGGMIIIDTLNRAAPGADENSPVDMGKIISSSSNLQRLTGGMVLLAHHTGKDETKKLRGHSSLPAALDGAIEVTRTGTSRQWAVAKSKDDKDGDSYPFKLDVVHLGIDKDDDAITSCVVAPCDSNNPTTGGFKVPQSGNQKIIWDALGNLLKQSKYCGKGVAPVMKACIEYEFALENTMSVLPCEKKRQRERAKAAITALVSNGFLKSADGWLWTP